MRLRYRPVNPWLFWAGVATLIVGIALTSVGPVPSGKGSWTDVAVPVDWLALALIVLSFALPADLPAVVRNNRSVEAGDGPPDSRPGELAPRAGGPPVS